MDALRQSSALCRGLATSTNVEDQIGTGAWCMHRLAQQAPKLTRSRLAAEKAEHVPRDRGEARAAGELALGIGRHALEVGAARRENLR